MPPPHFQQIPPTRFIGPIMRGAWEDSIPEFQTSSDIFGQRACRRVDGNQPPYYWGHKDYQGDIHHDSTCGFDTVDKSFSEDKDRLFETTGQADFHIWLDDDASIWRDDTPDSYAGMFLVLWELPSPRCSVRISCNIDTWHLLRFSNSADDGGGFLVQVGMQPTNENGEFDSGIIGYGITAAASSGLYQGGCSIGIEFFRPKDAIVRIIVAQFITLDAQDGLVDAAGSFYTNSPLYGGSPPSLSYHMVPI